SACWVKLGSTLMNSGRLVDATPALARAVDLADRAQQRSGAPSTELVDALRYSGDLSINSGSGKDALAFYRRAAAVMEQVAGRDPSEETSRRLAVTSFRTGEAEIEVGALADGERRIRSSVERIRRLAARAPDSPTYARELGIMYLALVDCVGHPD